MTRLTDKVTPCRNKVSPCSYKTFYLILILSVPIFGLLFINQSHSLQSSATGELSSTQTTSLSSLLPPPALVPIKTQVVPIEATAKAIYAIDVNSMAVLYEHNQNTTLPIASTAKLLTALLAIEHYSPDDWLLVNGVQTDGSNIGLTSGERYQVKDLLGALLIGSANDAAEVLATNFTGGLSGFVWSMNQKAIELGLKNSHFVNPVGFDHPDQYSTARDMAILSVEVMKHPLLASIVSQKAIIITNILKGTTLQANNTNELLASDPSVLGIKTGWTESAGECLISYVNRDNHPVLTVVLGSNNRFEETETLIDWIYSTYQWKPL